MPTYQFAPSDPVQLAHELNRCRQRGLADLDLPLHNKPPVPDEEIAGLTVTAEVYGAAIGADAYGRAARISRLIWDGLAAYVAEDPQDSEFIRACFDPSRPLQPPSDEPVAPPPAAGERLQRKKAPDELLKDVKLQISLGDAFDEYRHAVFARYMTFLNGFVLRAVAQATATREAAARREREAAAPRPRGPQRRPVWWRAAVAGLVATAVLLAALVVYTRLPPRPVPLTVPPVITGYAECWPDTTKAVEGVWIEAALGGSGWADWHALPGQPNVAAFSRMLPHGGSYAVHVGCGGDRIHWELPLDSLTALVGSGYFFACYDVPAADPSLGRCQP